MATQQLGRLLAQNEIALVYGGGNGGLMGLIADTVMSEGGKVYGVIPDFPGWHEARHSGITELHTVPTLHDRKKKMYEMSDAFIALPGGLGTLDEITEIVSWAQLDLHDKPCGLLNVENFFDHLLRYLDDIVRHEFMDQRIRDLFRTNEDPKELLKNLGIL